MAGFPTIVSCTSRILRFVPGDVIATSTEPLPGGYQILYTNPTLPGMSGGSVLNSSGQLVGIHGRGETDIKATQQSNVFIKTGTNLAMPINLYSKPSSFKFEVTSGGDDRRGRDGQFENYIVKAANLFEVFSREYMTSDSSAIDQQRAEELVSLTTKALEIKQDSLAYRIRADVKRIVPSWRIGMMDRQVMLGLSSSTWGSELRKQRAGALSDYTKAINLDPNSSELYQRRGQMYLHLSNFKYFKDALNLAQSDLKMSIQLDPSNFDAYKSLLKSYKDEELNQKRLTTDIVNLFPSRPESYVVNAYYHENASFHEDVNQRVDNVLKALSSYEKAIEISPNHFDAIAGLISLHRWVAFEADMYQQYYYSSGCKHNSSRNKCLKYKASAELSRKWGVGSYDSIIRYAERGIALNPESPSDMSRLYSAGIREDGIGDSVVHVLIRKGS